MSYPRLHIFSSPHDLNPKEHDLLYIKSPILPTFVKSMCTYRYAQDGDRISSSNHQYVKRDR